MIPTRIKARSLRRVLSQGPGAPAHTDSQLIALRARGSFSARAVWIGRTLLLAELVTGCEKNRCAQRATLNTIARQAQRYAMRSMSRSRKRESMISSVFEHVTDD